MLLSSPSSASVIDGRVVALNRDGFKSNYSNFGSALAATGIATVTINRPEVMNAINVPLAEALRDVALQLRADDARIRCVVLRGNGRAFVAGGDLAAFAKDFEVADQVADALLNALHVVALDLARGDVAAYFSKPFELGSSGEGFWFDWMISRLLVTEADGVLAH